MAHLFLDVDCRGEFWTGAEDDRNYNSSWSTLLPATNSSADHWSFQSAWKLKTIPYVGRLATYSGAGYVVELPSEKSDVISKFSDLQGSDWIDRNTAALFVEFTLYNPNVNLISVVIMVFEFSNVGNILPQYQIFTAKLYSYQNGLEIFSAVCEGFFVIYVIYFTCHEVKKFRVLRRMEYFADTWNYVEVIIIALSYSAIGLFFQRLVSMSSIMEEYRHTKQTKFISFYSAVIWDFIFTYVMAFLAVFVILKVFKMFTFNPRTSLLTDTLQFARKPLASFLLVVAIAAVAFGHCGLLLFGSHLLDYSDFLTTLLTLYNFTLGVSDYVGLGSANPVLGPAFFFLFCFTIHYILLVIFVSILMIGFSTAMSEYRQKEGDIPVTWYLYNHVAMMIGVKKTKDLTML